jgi:hypothetical protein
MEERRKKTVNFVVLPPVRCRPQYYSAWPTKSELRYAYYGRNKARIFNGAIDSANLKKCTLNQLHLLAKWKRKM